eukprot:CAMPEP_0203652696 /NCGR_PEP_ID=MMETSP0088-20131115/30713_1 /ASSEMBLY_ACC=CAM_ASM_001087 /TAXON_ID=426623 /ORGANISM="Chaetoceros affinis, Strain CCMP159" /LENGTH=41 /DNA_ID= /DNA_START= /DNA_END= /DNA_ORIENTATION=
MDGNSEAILSMRSYSLPVGVGKEKKDDEDDDVSSFLSSSSS